MFHFCSNFVLFPDWSVDSSEAKQWLPDWLQGLSKPAAHWQSGPDRAHAFPTASFEPLFENNLV